MKIQEGFHEEYESYTNEGQSYVEETYVYCDALCTCYELIERIANELNILQDSIMTKEELAQRQQQLYEFYVRMETMSFSTKCNMDRYRLWGWKQFVPDEIVQGSESNESCKPS